MPNLRELLNRFRPAGAPGAAGRAGVPADRAAELSAELGPVFRALATTTAQAATLRSAATAEAAARRAAAARKAQDIVAEAHRAAEGERAAAFSAAQADAGAEATRLLDEGRRAAAGISRRAEHLLPALVDSTVATALTEAGLDDAGLVEVGIRREERP
jgi:F0F1-type ATP synthase membrane subunit b/b'